MALSNAKIVTLGDVFYNNKVWQDNSCWLEGKVDVSGDPNHKWQLCVILVAKGEVVNSEVCYSLYTIIP